MPRSLRSIPRESFLHGGFSLVEVALAVGIAAFAVVSLLWLLPSGLTMFRGAMESSVGARISQQVFHDVQISEFGSLQSCYRYFDDQGREIFPSGTIPSCCLYVARVTLATNGGGMNPVSVLGNVSQNLARVTVDIAENRGGVNPAFLFLTNASFTTYTTLVGRNR